MSENCYRCQQLRNKDCKQCNKLFSKQIKDLRARLESAESRLISECLENGGLTNAEVIKALRESNKRFKQDRDNLQAEVKSKESILDNGYAKTERLYKWAREKLTGDIANEFWSIVANGSLLHENPEYQQRINILRHENNDLQAANGVLVEAFNKMLLSYKAKCDEDCGGDYCDGDCLTLANIKFIEQVISTTPAEAGERVRGLVEALEYYRETLEPFPCVDEYGEEYMGGGHFDEGKRAQNALAKYQGGAAK